MVTVIQPRQGNTGTDLLAALNTVLGTIEENRKYGQDEQLKLLSILAKQPGTSIEPVPTSQLQQPSFLDFLFGGQPRTLSGAPAARLGNQALQIGRQPALTQGDPLWAPTAAPATAVPGTDTNIYQTPIPQSNIPVPPSLAPIPTPTTGTPGSSAGLDNYKRLIVRQAQDKGIDPALALSVAQQESSWNPNAVGDDGEGQGFFQLHGPAAIDAGINPARRQEPLLNIAGGTEYLRQGFAKYPNDPQSVLEKHYNRGGDPNYYANVMQYYDTNKAYVASLDRDKPDTSMMVAGPGAPAPPTASSTPGQGKAYRDWNTQQGQPPSARPTTTAPVAQAPAPTPAEGQPAGPHEDRAIQLADRRVEANPDAPMVDVPGVGRRSQQWYRDYLARLAPFRSPGLYQTPDNIFKYAEAKRKAADDLDKDELQLRKDVQTMREKYPGQSDAFSNVTSQADLAGRAERRVLQPDQLQNAAMQDVRSAIAKAPRDANGTLTPAGAQYLADTAAYWGRYGVKPETFKPMLDAAGVSTAEAVQKERATIPVKVEETNALSAPKANAAAATKAAEITTEQRMQPFKDPTQIMVANNLSTDLDIPVEKFTTKMRQKVIDDAADLDAKKAGKVSVAQEQARASFGREIPENLRANLQEIANEKYGGDIRQAVASAADMQEAKSRYLDFKAKEAQINVQNRPIGDAEKQRVENLGNVKRVMVQLRDEFTPEERQKYVGLINRPLSEISDILGGILGGKKPTTAAEKEVFQKYNTLQPKQQRHFEEFLAVARQAEATAFDIGGKQLTEGEKRVVFGFIPTVGDLSAGRFMSKLNATVARADYLLGVHGLMAGATAGTFPELLKTMDKHITDMGAEMRKSSGQAPLPVPGSGEGGQAATTTPKVLKIEPVTPSTPKILKIEPVPATAGAQ